MRVNGYDILRTIMIVLVEDHTIIHSHHHLKKRVIILEMKNLTMISFLEKLKLFTKWIFIEWNVLFKIILSLFMSCNGQVVIVLYTVDFRWNVIQTIIELLVDRSSDWFHSENLFLRYLELSIILHIIQILMIMLLLVLFGCYFIMFIWQNFVFKKFLRGVGTNKSESRELIDKGVPKRGLNRGPYQVMWALDEKGAFCLFVIMSCDMQLRALQAWV